VHGIASIVIEDTTRTMGVRRRSRLQLQRQEKKILQGTKGQVRGENTQGGTLENLRMLQQAGHNVQATAMRASGENADATETSRTKMSGEDAE